MNFTTEAERSQSERRLSQIESLMSRLNELSTQLSKKSDEWSARLKTLAEFTKKVTDFKAFAFGSEKQLSAIAFVIDMTNRFDELKMSPFRAQFLWFRANVLADCNRFNESFSAYDESIKAFEQMGASQTYEMMELLDDYVSVLFDDSVEPQTRNRSAIAQRCCELHEKLRISGRDAIYLRDCFLAFVSYGQVGEFDLQKFVELGTKVHNNCSKSHPYCSLVSTRIAVTIYHIERSLSKHLLNVAISHAQDKGDLITLYEYLGTTEMYDLNHFDLAAKAFRKSIEAVEDLFGNRSEKLVRPLELLCLTFCAREVVGGDAEIAFTKLIDLYQLYPQRLQHEFQSMIKEHVFQFLVQRKGNLVAYYAWKLYLIERRNPVLSKNQFAELVHYVESKLAPFSADIICSNSWIMCIAVKIAIGMECINRELLLLFTEGSEIEFQIAHENRDILTTAFLTAVAKNPNVAARRFALKWSGELPRLEDCEEREVLSMVTEQTKASSKKVIDKKT